MVAARTGPANATPWRVARGLQRPFGRHRLLPASTCSYGDADEVPPASPAARSVYRASAPLHVHDLRVFGFNSPLVGADNPRRWIVLGLA
jgi:hypothetical protein